MYIFSIIALVLTLCSCKDSSSLEQLKRYGSSPFDQQRWKLSKHRLDMVWRLAVDRDLCTKSTSQLVDLLGNSDGYFISEKYLSWQLSSHQQFAFKTQQQSPYPAFFAITYDNHVMEQISCS
ncbi:hypothetical protein EYY87_20185 [Hafnia paralvei]|uniref:hypothetical protein n=1 Tax=Hafnia paralvei TaxID=546367 RepID=UPI00103407D8|nr:hypothetical protein [Hafnia paralvei]TBM01288.1 hypothetical protein EYY87_20185 [Hafnia paralvei]